MMKTESGPDGVRSWTQTILLILTLVGGLLWNERRLTSMEMVQTLQEARINKLEILSEAATKALADNAKVQERLLTLEERTIKRHEEEDNARFRALNKRMGINP